MEKSISQRELREREDSIRTPPVLNLDVFQDMFDDRSPNASDNEEKGKGEEESSWFDVLPHEIVAHIFSFLDAKSLSTCAHVSSRFYFVALDVWNVVQITGGRHLHLTDQEWQFLGNRRVLKFLVDGRSDKATIGDAGTLRRESSQQMNPFLPIGTLFENLSSLHIHFCDNFSDKHLEFVPMLPHLTDLGVIGCGLISNTTPIAALTELRRLDLSHCFSLQETSLMCVGSLWNLRSLRLDGCPVDDNWLNTLSLSGIMNIMELSLRARNSMQDGIGRGVDLYNDSGSSRTITDDGLICVVSAFSRLTNLDLCGRQSISDRGLGALSKSTLMVHLNLSGGSYTDGGLRALSPLKKLQTLNLCSSEIRGRGFGTFAGLTRLRVLNLSHCQYLHHIYPLRKLVNLKTLTLSNCPRLHTKRLKRPFITNSFFRFILRLDVSHGDVRNGFCRRLAKKALNLLSLNLSCCSQIGDRGIGYLTALTQLVTLHLNSCPRLTDAGLGTLGRHPRLRRLSLAAAGSFTNVGLKNLSLSRSLMDLDLSYANAITSAGVSQLSAIPCISKVRLQGCQELLKLDSDVNITTVLDWPLIRSVLEKVEPQALMSGTTHVDRHLDKTLEGVRNLMLQTDEPAVLTFNVPQRYGYLNAPSLYDIHIQRHPDQGSDVESDDEGPPPMMPEGSHGSSVSQWGSVDFADDGDKEEDDSLSDVSSDDAPPPSTVRSSSMSKIPDFLRRWTNSE